MALITMNDISGADSVVADATFENDLPGMVPALKDRAKFKMPLRGKRDVQIRA